MIIEIPILGWLPNEPTNGTYTDGRSVHYISMHTVKDEPLIALDSVIWDAYSDTWHGIMDFSYKNVLVPLTAEGDFEDFKNNRMKYHVESCIVDGKSVDIPAEVK